MADEMIKCPDCGCEIPLTDTLIKQVEDRVRNEFEAIMDEEINKKLSADRKKMKKTIEDETKKRIKEEMNLEMIDMQNQLKENKLKLKKSEKLELELRIQQRELIEKEEKLNLEITRKLDEERQVMKKAISEQYDGEYKFKISEKEKIIDDMRKQIDELRRKSDQASQQLIGEVMELDLEEYLKSEFPYDKIEPVAKGVRGADILQKVISTSGNYCGTIIWESKRAKNWSNKWMEKLKTDQRKEKADVAILVSTAFPKDISRLHVQDGVLLTEYQFVLPIASLIRNQIIEVTNVKKSFEGVSEKKDLIYSYLISHEFRQKIQIVFDACVQLQAGVDNERLAMEKLWKKREKEIKQAVIGLVGMYGEMEGIIGASLPEINGLELSDIPSITYSKKMNGGDKE